jgi:hypothetical protein
MASKKGSMMTSAKFTNPGLALKTKTGSGSQPKKINKKQK